MALEHQLRLGAKPWSGRRRVFEQRGGERPAALHGVRGRGPASGEAPAAALLALNRAEPWRAQRGEGIVRNLARPREIPQRVVKLLGRDVELVHEVDPERWATTQELADRIVDLAVGRLDLDVRRRRTGEPHVLAEVQGDLAAAAAQRAASDPHDLAAGAQLVEPGRAVGAKQSRQDIPFPDLGSQRDPLQRHQRLAQPVGPGARGAVGVDVLPARQEARQLTRLYRLGLGAQVGEARAPEAAEHVGIAPLALAPDKRAAALELLQRRRWIDAVAARRLLGRERAMGPRVAADERDHRFGDPLEE